MSRLTKWDEEKKKYIIDPAIGQDVIDRLGRYEDGRIPAEFPFPGHGVFTVYNNDEKGCPGLTVTFRPENGTAEIDLAYIRGIISDEKDAKTGDISIMAYGDPYDENPTY